MLALLYSQKEGAALNVYTVQAASRETALLWIPKKLCDRTGRRAQIIAYPLSATSVDIFHQVSIVNKSL